MHVCVGIALERRLDCTPSTTSWALRIGSRPLSSLVSQFLKADAQVRALLEFHDEILNMDLPESMRTLLEQYL